jgi:hypothetical protein
MSRLLQGSSRILQVDKSSSLLGDSGIFFRDSSEVDINDKKNSNNLPFGIDGNLVKKPCSPYLRALIPMAVVSYFRHANSPCFHASSFTIFLSPFYINGKG